MDNFLVIIWEFFKEEIGFGIIIQSLLIILGWIIAFIIMAKQVRKSYKFNLAAQIKLFKRQIKYESYKSIIESSTKFGNSLTDLFGFLSNVKMKLTTLEEYEKQGFQPFKWDTVPNELISVDERISESFLNLVFTYENHEIPLGEVKNILDEIKKVYFDEVSSKVHDLHSLWFKSISVLTMIPIKEHRKDIENKIKTIIDKIFTVQIFIYDLRVELQNEIFGEMFNRKLPKRKPTSQGIPPTSID